jgi:ATP-binding cassette subfamily B protein
MTSVLQENLTGIRVVRAFARQDYENEKFAERNRQFRDCHYRLIRLMATYWPLSDAMVFGQKAAVLLAGAYLVAGGTLTVGTLVAFLLFVNMYIWPLRQMGRILADLGKALVALGRIDEILTAERETDEAQPAIPHGAPVHDDVRPPARPERLRGDVTFENVSFAYEPGQPVLRAVSFHVAAGQTLAIVGPSGSGKSTIVNLLLRLYDGATGSIRIDGHELSSFARSAIRSQISVVMQEPFLYSKTVRENIALGRSDADEHELIEAAGIAAIHESVIGFDKGYETLVGERGVTLSGGQRQRVALARAMLQQPVVLIMDDALSAVDTHTETLILQALRERRGRHTTIAIAHRLSTLREADRILVLEHGRVAQCGTHEALLEEPGLYRRLWQIQGAVAGAAG